MEKLTTVDKVVTGACLLLFVAGIVALGLIIQSQRNLPDDIVFSASQCHVRIDQDPVDGAPVWECHGWPR